MCVPEDKHAQIQQLVDQLEQEQAGEAEESVWSSESELSQQSSSDSEPPLREILKGIDLTDRERALLEKFHRSESKDTAACLRSTLNSLRARGELTRSLV